MAKAIEKDNDCRVAFDKDRCRAGHLVLLHYAITRQDHKGPELLGFPLGFDEEALGVFSTKEVAQSFVLLKALGQEWRVRKFSAGELVSLLMGPYAAIDWVLLTLCRAIRWLGVLHQVSCTGKASQSTSWDDQERGYNGHRSLPRVDP